MPRAVIYVGAVLVALSLVPLALMALARLTPSPVPREQIVPDMDSQPRYRPQTANPFFTDGRAMRAPVAGTVARGDLPADSVLVTGRAGGELVAINPLPASGAALARGRQRFGIYCAPCHGLAGEGNGPVSLRAEQLREGTWTPPSDLASDEVRARADGHLFSTITDGIRNMPAYGSQIPPEDRWAVVAYVRALQLARHATLQDVPPEARDRLR